MNTARRDTGLGCSWMPDQVRHNDFEDDPAPLQQKINHGLPHRSRHTRGGSPVQGVKKKERTETPVGFVPQNGGAELELTIVIPCLNEAETLAQVIDRALRFLHAYG